MKRPLALILFFFFLFISSQAQFDKIGNFLSEIVLKGKAQTQLELGAEKFDAQDFEGALLHFDKVVEIKPKKNIGWRLRGLSRLMLGDLNEALADFDQAIEIESWDYYALYFRSATLLSLQKAQIAKKDLDQCRELAPDWEFTSCGLALYHTQVQQMDSALFYLNRTLSINPKMAYAFELRGMIYFQVEEYMLAYKDFKQAIALQNVNPSVLLNYGISATEIGDLEEAIRVTQDLKARFPNHPNVNILAGSILLIKGELQEGLTILQKVIPKLRRLKDENRFEDPTAFHIRPSTHTISQGFSPSLMGALFFIIGRGHIELGHWDEASASLDSAIFYLGEELIILEKKGLLHVELDQWDKAEVTFEKCLQQEPENPMYIFLLASAYYSQSKPSKALPHLERLMEFDSLGEDYDEFHFILASTYYQLKKDQKALALIEQYLPTYTGPQKKVILMTAASIHSATYNWKEVESYASQAIKESPDYAVGYYTRGESRKKQQNTDGALSDYLTAYKLGNGDDQFRVDLAYRIGMIYVNKADYDQACTFLTKAANKGHQQAKKYKTSICK